MSGDNKKRSNGEGHVRFVESRQRWLAETMVGYGPNGKKIMRSGWGHSETEARRKMRKAVADYRAGLTTDAPRYTVAKAVGDWLTNGQSRKAGLATRKKNANLCAVHITPLIGGQRMSGLTVPAVETWLQGRAEVLATRSLQEVRRCLHQAVKRSVALGLAEHKVLLAVELAQMPGGQVGRPSKSLTMKQALGVLTLTVDDPIHAYIVVSLLTGIRTEEVRALRWDHVKLNDKPSTVWVWRSDRVGGDTKTTKSRRTLALPAQVVTVLKAHKATQAAQRLGSGTPWDESRFVFATSNGTALDAANVRRSFRRALRLAVKLDLARQVQEEVPEAEREPLLDPDDWTPRELRHSFVSLLSEEGVPVEEIARLVGHKGGSQVTERVYRHELRPVLETGAQAMDRIFGTPKTGQGR